MIADPPSPDIFGYTSGPAWLTLWMDWWLELRRRHTREQFARQAGVVKSNVSNVLRGQRIPSPETLESYNRVFGLDDNAFSYLLLLYEWERETDHDQRLRLLQEIQRRQREHVARTRPAFDPTFIETWENVVLREAARGRGIPADPTRVAALFRHDVDLAAIVEAIRWLTEKRMLVPTPDGMLVADRDAIRASGIAPRARGTHRRALEEAHRAIETVPALERELRILMVNIRREDLPLLRAELGKFIGQVGDIGDHSATQEVVYQVTVQMIPVVELRGAVGGASEATSRSQGP